jgi:predicted phosphodiesterase
MVKKILVLPDLHAPYHDKKAYELFIKAARIIKPDTLVVIGDFADFYAVSSHLKDPTRPGFSREVKEVRRQLEALRGIGTRRLFLAGNHENRLDRYLQSRAPELYGTLTVPEILGLEEEGFEYHPYQEVITIGKVSFVHDLGFSGVNGTRQTLAAYPGNIVYGHTHRFNCYTKGDLKRNTYTAWNVGWLGDSHKIDYLPAVKVKQDWVKGFLLVYLEDNGTPHFSPMKITNNKVLLEGKLITT